MHAGANMYQLAHSYIQHLFSTSKEFSPSVQNNTFD